MPGTVKLTFSLCFVLLLLVYGTLAQLTFSQGWGKRSTTETPELELSIPYCAAVKETTKLAHRFLREQQKIYKYCLEHYEPNFIVR